MRAWAVILLVALAVLVGVAVAVITVTMRAPTTDPDRLAAEADERYGGILDDEVRGPGWVPPATTEEQRAARERGDGTTHHIKPPRDAGAKGWVPRHNAGRHRRANDPLTPPD